MSRTIQPGNIPDGLVFQRAAWFGSQYSTKFEQIHWPGKLPNEKHSSNCDSPIFLFQSEPYLSGTGLNLQVVRHVVIATVFSDYHLKESLESLGPASYPTIDFFWHDHPRTISYYDCGGELKDHVDAEDDSYCTYCGGTLNFNSIALTNLLHDKLSWPFPTESILTTKTFIRSLDTSSTTDLRDSLTSVGRNLNHANNLLTSQDVALHSTRLRQDLEATYQATLLEIEREAAESAEEYRRLVIIGLGKENLEAQATLLNDRIQALENGEAIAEMKRQVDDLNTKIASLQAQPSSSFVASP